MRSTYKTAYDRVQAIEQAFENVLSNASSNRYLFNLKELASNLLISEYYNTKAKNADDTNSTKTTLLGFKINVARRKKRNDRLTASRLMALNEPARTILLSDIAYAFRDEIDNFTQIDFANAKHMKLLKTAVDSSISKVADKQGRPANEPLDEFFIGLRDLYEAATGKTAIATAHYNNEPKTDFEKLIYLGYQIIRPAQKYPSALKAYERAISRNS